MKTYKMEINGEKFEGKVIEYDGINAKIEINGITYQVKMEPEFAGKIAHFARPKKVLTIPPTLSGKSSGALIHPGQVRAPLPGTIIDILVKEGDKISAGDVVLILEAMKMESEIAAPTEGTVKQIKVAKGDSVTEDQILVEIEVNQ